MADRVLRNSSTFAVAVVTFSNDTQRSFSCIRRFAFGCRIWQVCIIDKRRTELDVSHKEKIAKGDSISIINTLNANSPMLCDSGLYTIFLQMHWCQ
jgi:hypothetical protein